MHEQKNDTQGTLTLLNKTEQILKKLGYQEEFKKCPEMEGQDSEIYQ